MERWSDVEKSGLLRLTNTSANAGYARRLVDDLGEADARRLFAAVSRVAENGRGSTRLTASGLRRIERLRGRRIGVDDIRAFETSLSRARNVTVAGERAQAAALRLWRRNDGIRDVIDLDTPDIPKRYGRYTPVVDVAIIERGSTLRRFASVADGGLEYSIRKYEDLVGIRGAGRFRQMLDVLGREFRVGGSPDFMRRAQLRIPQVHVEPLRAVIASRFNELAYRRIRRAHGLRLGDLLEMVQPLPN